MFQGSYEFIVLFNVLYNLTHSVLLRVQKSLHNYRVKVIRKVQIIVSPDLNLFIAGIEKINVTNVFHSAEA